MTTKRFGRFLDECVRNCKGVDRKARHDNIQESKRMKTRLEEEKGKVDSYSMEKTARMDPKLARPKIRLYLRV